ncbi:ImmA/IrrE family metallo-endopeptidase [Arcanobacterium pinnipediorum]|uniref:ImmA/IrrE family metallo-endopeptidase n=1 Tax=Arcanobacterium pinnipediorum TaxID=1503041 RepID=A0ABY5AJK5_9ACTO|nr:ImmA/IrrE family metallo-endopeptidase [Arcanobacterium pinnipediorum]USR79373.1 ImmA/IrrE family metallo-endopeptidase [Arcanobacterium pinnipediorum]
MFTGKTVGEIREMARKDAADVLEVHWNGEYPVDPIVIARKLGASVFMSELGDDVYGMLRKTDMEADIYIDRDQSTNRQRFTCAHEVGHLVSHRDESGDFVDARSDEGRGTASEIYANEFAAELLMPAPELRRKLENSDSAYGRVLAELLLADYFDVSLAALQYRRKLLGV